MPGTFTITGTLVNSGSDTAIPIGAGTLALAAAVDADGKYILCAGGTGRVYVVRVNTATNSWVLVGPGGGTYAFASLPGGLTILTAQLNYGGVGGSVTNFYGGSDSFCNANSSASVEFDALTSRTLIRASLAVSPLSPFIDTRFPGGSVLDLNNNGYGFRFNNPGSAVDFEVDILTITGTYDLLSANWTLPSATIKAGDKVPLTSVSPLAQGVTQILLQHGGQTTKVAAQDFIDQTPTQITFYMPEFGNFTGTIVVSVIGNGVQFSGTVFAGLLTVLFVDASGIYTLTPLKPTDTTYSGARDGTTVDVAIQDPTIETAFIP